MNRVLLLIVVLMTVMTQGCIDEKTNGEPQKPKHQIIVLYSPGGLGDNGYNDCILRGVQSFRKEYSDLVDMYQYQPSTMEEAQRILTDWLALPESNIPALFIAASSDYETLAVELTTRQPLTANKRMLLFESSLNDAQFSTFRISMYGACYLAGVSARYLGCERVLTLLSNPYDLPIGCGADGFIDGYTASGGNTPEILYLADDWTGYIMPDVAYRNMTEWSEKYDFIFPVAGGTNAGIYRYSRENPDNCPLLAGMDIDQSPLSTHITGSVIKEIDKTIYDYIYTWFTTGELPESRMLGLSTGDCEWLPSARYHDRLAPIIQKLEQTAVKKELEYESQYN